MCLEKKLFVSLDKIRSSKFELPRFQEAQIRSSNFELPDFSKFELLLLFFAKFQKLKFVSSNLELAALNLSWQLEFELLGVSG